MTLELAETIMGISGGLIGILLLILGYFLKIIHNDTKKAIEEVGKNKGRIELVELQLNSDVKRLEQTTQLELRTLAQTVTKLSASVEQLVQIQLQTAAARH
jgi:uncharacterized protein YoxC